MSIENVIDFWRSEGEPLIHLGQGENCLDLEKLLNNSNVRPEQLEAVKTWLEKVLK